MTRSRLYAVLLVVLLIVCGLAWYLFRPEKAFVNDTVNEPPPPGVPADTGPEPNTAHPAQ
jgi:hypothetical protein